MMAALISRAARGIVALSIAILVAVPFASVSHARQSHDWTIVPGVRVGPITPKMSKAELIAVIGHDKAFAGNVRDAHGRYHEGVVVYPKTVNELRIIWHANGSGIRFIRIAKADTRWRTAGGIGMGTTASALAQANGRAFLIQGFDTDQGGTVRSWDGGRLHKGLSVLLTPHSAYDGRAYKKVSGNRLIRSDHPVMRTLDLKVTAILLVF